ncbi:hypothetical protein VNI00_005408 [Paramarasmius palmivorus]|uniref:Cytochrome P450 n=1 Tax=Paramarasmius palmivorus TaxID=297713 RepID=A0AAW0DFT6_9AGAR
MPHILVQLTLAVSTLYIATKIARLRALNANLHSVPSIGGDGLSSYVNGLRYYRNARKFIQEGYEKYQGRVFKIPTLTSWEVVVTSPQLVDDLRKAPDDALNFFEAVNDSIAMEYTMGEPIHRDPYHINIVRGKLTKNLGVKFDDVRDEIVTAFADEMPATSEWTKRSIGNSIFRIVARASNRLFVGLPLCRELEYLNLNINFTLQVVVSAYIINLFPEFLKPVAGRFLTPATKSIQRVRKFLEPIIIERSEKQEKYGDQWSDKPNDFLMWCMDTATGPQRSIQDFVMRMLGTNFAAIHTSSMTFTDALYYLAAHPEYVPELRQEIEGVVENHGWSKSSFQHMRKLDSFLKESGRLAGLGGLASGRKALKDFTFSDGTTIPAGAVVSIPAAGIHFDTKYYDDPYTFKPWRFSELRDSADEEGIKHQMITPNTEYVLFGVGRHACPGRFFAVNELKLLLAHVIVTYDVKFEDEGKLPDDTWIGANRMPNRYAEIMYRKRVASV